VVDLDSLVRTIREYPGLTDKRYLSMVAGSVGGDGDDAARVGDLVLAAEAIAPSFIARSPRTAGIAGVVATLNDVAASGGEPIAILDTVVGSAAINSEMLEGLTAAADLYGVPIVGGHTTVDTADAALSVFGVGRAAGSVAIANAHPGDILGLAICTNGELVGGGAGDAFFSHLRGPRRDAAATDLMLLPQAAAAGELRAARDISMPGLAGSLIQMLDGTGLGAALNVDRVPRPDGVAIADWMVAFQSYGFLVVGDIDALARRFGASGIPFAAVGTLNETGVVHLSAGDESRELWDLSRDPLTGFGQA